MNIVLVAAQIALRTIRAVASAINILSTNGATGPAVPTLPETKKRDDYRP